MPIKREDNKMSKHQFPVNIVALFLSFMISLPTQGQQSSSRFVEVIIPAPSLEGNLLGEPTKQPISIYLPPSYDTSPDKRYPVIYLLHGFTGSNRTWMVDSELNIGEPPPGSTDIGYGYNIMPILDTLIAEGKIREMIVVAPSTMNAYKHAYFVNSSAAGNWEDYLLQDVLSYVDGNYRTLAQASSRGITGHSGGGSSAVYVGMRHPDVFSTVYSLPSSPWRNCFPSAWSDFGSNRAARSRARPDRRPQPIPVPLPLSRSSAQASIARPRYD